MPLSAANVIQAKTGRADANTTASVVLDAGTQAGSTVTVEITAGGVPFLLDGLDGHAAAGFEFDGYSDAAGVHYLHAFHKNSVAAGEGIAGSTSWDFTYIAAANWAWRVIEWDVTLGTVDPLIAQVSNTDTGTSPTNLSTGTTQTLDASLVDVVCLAWHHWVRATNTAQTMTFSNHTNGFSIRDELRWTVSTSEFSSCWSWAFPGTNGPFETTADINLATRNAGDTYTSMLVAYTAEPAIIVPAPTVVSG